jgi:hypothetical protein
MCGDGLDSSGLNRGEWQDVVTMVMKVQVAILK